MNEKSKSLDKKVSSKYKYIDSNIINMMPTDPKTALLFVLGRRDLQSERINDFLNLQV